MKKIKIITILILLMGLMSFEVDTKYCKGWDAGYKRGWCYRINNTNCEQYVFVPICPLPRYGESAESYRDGYDRGFALALYKRQYETTL